MPPSSAYLTPSPSMTFAPNPTPTKPRVPGGRHAKTSSTSSLGHKHSGGFKPSPPPYSQTSNPKSSSSSSSSSSTPSITLTMLALFRSVLFTYIVPRLPVELQDIAYNPPDLSDPSSLVPIIKAVAPYTQIIIVLLAAYIIWAFVAGVIGYAARFIRFAFRIGPVIALIAWLMAASGQGGIDVIVEALKEYAGLQSTSAPAEAPATAGAGLGAGAAGRAGRYFFSSSDDESRASTRRTRRKNKYNTAPNSDAEEDSSSSSFWKSPRKHAVHSNTNSNAKTRGGRHDREGRHGSRNTRAKAADTKNQNKKQPDQSPSEILAGLLGTTVDEDSPASVVQDFVKKSLLKASGLDWLLGGHAQAAAPAA